jgi:glycosyltransferase involved in cell wall biosynthesis
MLKPLNSDFHGSTPLPRVLLEAFPLTIRQGTGIFNYSLHLLQAFNKLNISHVGLLLLFENRIYYPKRLASQQPLIQLQSYAQLLANLHRNRANLQQQAWYQKRLYGRSLSRLAEALTVATLPLQRIDIVKIPEHFKASLLEIITGGNSLVYDFITENTPYFVNLSRHDLLLRSLLGLSNTVDLKRWQTHYDVFHCTHLSPLYVPAIPRVTTIHDIVPLLRPELVNSKLPFAFTRLLAENIKASDKIIAVSESTRNDLVKFCGVPPEKIVVIYEAASSLFQPIEYAEAKPFLQSVGLIDHYDRPVPYFLFMGNIEPKKNIRRILLAFREFCLRQQGRWKLVVVGAKAWGYESVKDLMQGMIEQQVLIHLDYLPTSHLPLLLSHATAFLFPSLAEGFGLPVLEAMSCGCPVIVSGIAALQEVCGEAAIQVNPQSIPEIYQAIALLANNPSLRATLGQKGLQRSRQFSWSDCASKTLAVYQEVCQQRPRR